MRTIHVVIPDTQVRREVDGNPVPIEHLGWIGQYIVDKYAGRPNVTVIHIGDHYDMASLSSYDKGKKQMEGRRYLDDVEVGNAAFDLLCYSMENYNATKRVKWQPDLHFFLGNHEERIARACTDNAQLDGTIGYHQLNAGLTPIKSQQDYQVEHHGWTVHPFLQPVMLDGVAYSHYFLNPANGRPVAGMIETRIKTIGCTFTQGHQQGLRSGILETFSGRKRGMVAGSCLTPDHKVLTADLRYIPLGEVGVGDELVSFDETVDESPGRSRRYKTGLVTAIQPDTAEVFAVTLENGKVFKVTGDHRWLTRVGGQASQREGATYRWRITESMKPGTVVPKLLDEWEILTSHEAGYLAGMYDGEGCYYSRETTAGHVGQLTLSQKSGPVLDRTIAALESLVGVEGYTCQAQGRGVKSLYLKGGMRSVIKMLGSVRPTRLLPKFVPAQLGSVTTNENTSVVSIEPLGMQTIIRIEIDAGTMIVEGYPHHNCYLHNEEYRGPQGTNEWRGIVVCYNVGGGDYDLKEVSLASLCRRYEGIDLNKWLKKYYPMWTTL
jgi:hypothetical protein